MTRRARRRRVEPDGSTLSWPGARDRFALFAEVLWIGVLMTIVALPLVTWPAAVAAGATHLRRFLHAEATPPRRFFEDVRSALPGSLVVGTASAVMLALIALDVALATSGGLPGGSVVAIAVTGVGLLVVTAVVLVASNWVPEARWRDLVRELPRRVERHVAGALLVLLAVVLGAVVTWQLVPLAMPAFGLLAFAAVTVPERHRRTGARLHTIGPRVTLTGENAYPGIVPLPESPDPAREKAEKR